MERKEWEAKSLGTLLKEKGVIGGNADMKIGEEVAMGADEVMEEARMLTMGQVKELVYIVMNHSSLPRRLAEIDLKLG